MNTPVMTSTASSARPSLVGPDVDRDRGSITVWLALSAVVMIILVGVAVDLCGQVYAKQRCQDIAAQAARAGGQQLDAGTAIRGQGAIADPSAAVGAAKTYIAGTTDVTGTATATADTVNVTTNSTYQTKFLSIIGIGSLPVSGHAQAHITRAVGGVAR